MSYIPTLDLAGERDEATRVLVAALEDPGFLYLKNVPGYDPGIAALSALTLLELGSLFHVHAI